MSYPLVIFISTRTLHAIHQRINVLFIFIEMLMSMLLPVVLFPFVSIFSNFYIISFKDLFPQWLIDTDIIPTRSLNDTYTLFFLSLKYVHTNRHLVEMLKPNIFFHPLKSLLDFEIIHKIKVDLLQNLQLNRLHCR